MMHKLELTLEIKKKLQKFHKNFVENVPLLLAASCRSCEGSCSSLSLSIDGAKVLRRSFRRFSRRIIAACAIFFAILRKRLRFTQHLAFCTRVAVKSHLP